VKCRAGSPCDVTGVVLDIAGSQLTCEEGSFFGLFSREAPALMHQGYRIRRQTSSKIKCSRTLTGVYDSLPKKNPTRSLSSLEIRKGKPPSEFPKSRTSRSLQYSPNVNHAQTRPFLKQNTPKTRVSNLILIPKRAIKTTRSSPNEQI
jgi:hypothetical protein